MPPLASTVSGNVSGSGLSCHHKLIMKNAAFCPKLSVPLSFTRHAAEPADQRNPRVNIIYTHSHDPLHCLQLQGVFVAVQHLLQVIMSGGRIQQLSAQATIKDSDYTSNTISYIDQSLQVWPRNDSLWSGKSIFQNMETFEIAVHKSSVIGKWHKPQNMPASQRDYM